MVLSVDEKTQVQALDRTQPVLPVTCEATEKRTHDYVRHGTTNLFAALNTATGEVLGECRPTRNGADFLAFLRKAARPHRGREIHIVLDNLSTHTTPDVRAWLEKKPFTWTATAGEILACPLSTQSFMQDAAMARWRGTDLATSAPTDPPALIQDARTV
ncbi:transposase [Streptomyces sp. NPDC001581]|uniref:transposase n=1 Tax=Streptomyces sp. NPDC001581 TaxID=3154386 RepID=UPI00332A59D2